MKGSILTILLAFGILIGAAYFSSQGIVGINFRNTENSNDQNQRDNSSEVAGEATEEIECSGEATPLTTDGPYYIANSPEQTDISNPGTNGESLTLTGYVLNKNCDPIRNAWLDFWQADGEGNYDNDGYNLRGHQFTDSEGRYTLRTVFPAEYENRTPHIHVKVAKNAQSPPITTQLFIPGLDSNNSDEIYNSQLDIQLEDSENGMIGRYNFIVE